MIQQMIQLDLLAGASTEVDHDEQLDFVDYCLAAHCGFAPFYLPNEMIPLVPTDADVSDVMQAIQAVAAQYTDEALNDGHR